MLLPPYNRFLAILAVAALTRPHGEAWAVQQAQEWGCCPSGKTGAEWLTPVLVRVVYPRLSPVSQAYLATFMPGLTPTEPLAGILAELGFTGYLEITPSGLNLRVLEFYSRWREDSNLRLFLDTCYLAGIAPAVLQADVRLMWNVTATPEDIAAYCDLFIDRDLILRGGWESYAVAYGNQAEGFVRQLVRQPHDYVRWKLGVPVSLDSEMVLDRLISESYYTERLIKQEMGTSGLSRDQLARVKMERDTLLKCLDRRIKLKESKKGGGDGEDVAAAALAALGKMTLKYEKNEFPTVEEITGSAPQAYNEPPKPVEPLPATPA